MTPIEYTDIADALDKMPVLSRGLYIRYVAITYSPTCIDGSSRGQTFYSRIFKDNSAIFTN